MPTLIPTCPACSHPDTDRETDDRWQCQRCGWRFTFDPDTRTASDLFPWRTAGRSRSRRPQRGTRFID